MSTPMRCLLDKVAARRIMEALLKLASAQELTAEEIHALDLYERAGFPGMRLFIVPPTDNVLKRLALVCRLCPVDCLIPLANRSHCPCALFQTLGAATA